MAMWLAKMALYRKILPSPDLGDGIKCRSSSRPPDSIRPTWNVFDSGSEKIVLPFHLRLFFHNPPTKLIIMFFRNRPCLISYVLCSALQIEGNQLLFDE